MFKKKASSILAVALILGVLGVAAVAMAAPANNGMSCADPEKRQQMLDSHVKSGMMTQEQADLMKKNMDQMMNGGHGNHNMPQGPMNPMMPNGPQGNPPTSTPGK
jgi:hypothetical protein